MAFGVYPITVSDIKGWQGQLAAGLDPLVAPGGPEPRSELSGAVIVSGPAMMAMVTVHWPLLVPAGQLLPAAAEVTKLARLRSPVSGLLTVTE
jgi:hypothetical protein